MTASTTQQKTGWVQSIDNQRIKKPAYNERFGATAAVTPLKVTCEHERKYPAERLVKAAATPSRRHVSGKRRESGRQRRKELKISII